MAAIPNGVPVVIDSGISAPGAGNAFTFPLDPSGNDFSGVFEVISGTTISADLQVSLDGGTTWSTLQAAILTAVPPAAGSSKVITPLIGGALYRLNYTTATGSITVRACAN